MRQLIVQQFVTVDNVMSEPDGGMSFVDDYVADPDAEFLVDAETFMDSIDTMVLGANTYQQFVQYWPNATNEGVFGDKLNGLTKYVASTSLQQAPWGKWPAANIMTDAISTVGQLKTQPGKDIVVWGSGQLTRQLAAAGLVDRYQLRIVPITRGDGQRLFDTPQALHLLTIKSYPKGMVLATYAPMEAE